MRRSDIQATVAAFLMCCTAACTKRQEDEAPLGASSAKSASSPAGAAPPPSASGRAPATIADFVTEHSRRRGSIAFKDYSTGCAIAGNGRVGCWGHIDVARPGVFTEGKYEPLPALLPDVRDATWIDAVGDRFCVVAGQDGRVLCWGEHWPDMAAAKKRKAVDAKPTRIAGIDQVTKVVLGENFDSGRNVGPWHAWGGTHHCALRNDGTVWCWGNNQWGQMGHAKIPYQGRPMKVQGLEHVVDLDATGAVNCAVTADGRVWCWGMPVVVVIPEPAASCSYPRPPGEEEVVACVPTPRPIPGIDTAAAVALGGGSRTWVHACVLTRDRRVFCWGVNRCGEAGRNDSADGLIPPDRAAQSPVPIDDVVQLSLSVERSCALRRDGAVFCWGCDKALSDKPEVRGIRRDPTRMLGIERAVEVLATPWGGCARDPSGGATCWVGGKGAPRIGDGRVPLPLRVIPPFG